MKTTFHLNKIAALTAATGTEQVAVLSAELTAGDDGWFQLLPAGYFSARDGRPHDVPGNHWFIDGEIATQLIARVRDLGQPVLIDYEHQTLRAAQNGQPAPAAGWFNADEMQWRDGAGLFIRPRWTERALALIGAGEYRFLSAVFPYDLAGRPLELRMAALTNDPGVTGMESLAALAAEKFPTHRQQEDTVPEYLKQLLTRLGVTVADGVTQIDDATGQAALSALDALQANAARVPQLEQNVAALTAQNGQTSVDLRQYVPVSTYNALRVQLAALSASSTESNVDHLLAEARKTGKSVAAEDEYLRGFAEQHGVAELTALLGARAPIAALAAADLQSSGAKRDEPSLAVLTAEEKEAARMTGRTEAEYLELKQKQGIK
ncbi:protease [Salmonella enterica]|nr:protease [Salmonella enterica]